MSKYICDCGRTYSTADGVHACASAHHYFVPTSEADSVHEFLLAGRDRKAAVSAALANLPSAQLIEAGRKLRDGPLGAYITVMLDRLESELAHVAVLERKIARQVREIEALTLDLGIQDHVKMGLVIKSESDDNSLHGDNG